MDSVMLQVRQSAPAHLSGAVMSLALRVLSLTGRRREEPWMALRRRDF